VIAPAESRAKPFPDVETAQAARRARPMLLAMNRAALSLAAALAALTLLVPGCGSLTVASPESEGKVKVRLDSNARSYAPGLPLKLKFFVDMTNESGRTLSMEGLKIELRAFPADNPASISLRQSWTYRHPQKVYLADGKKFSIPIVPERAEQGGTAGEFPLELLPEGEYGIVAVVNGMHASPPYRLKIERPDLEPSLRRT
jgi:hypothetical protein